MVWLYTLLHISIFIFILVYIYIYIYILFWYFILVCNIIFYILYSILIFCTFCISCPKFSFYFILHFVSIVGGAWDLRIYSPTTTSCNCCAWLEFWIFLNSCYILYYTTIFDGLLYSTCVMLLYYIFILCYTSGLKLLFVWGLLKHDKGPHSKNVLSDKCSWL